MDSAVEHGLRNGLLAFTIIAGRHCPSDIGGTARSCRWEEIETLVLCMRNSDLTKMLHGKQDTTSHVMFACGDTSVVR